MRKNELYITKKEVSTITIATKEVEKEEAKLHEGIERTKAKRVYKPAVDIIEKNISVTLNKDSLTLKGEKKEEKEDNDKGYHRLERSYGSFCRTIPLPVEIESDKVSASYKKGILTITIPKSEKAIEEKKKIKIAVE